MLEENRKNLTRLPSLQPASPSRLDPEYRVDDWLFQRGIVPESPSLKQKEYFNKLKQKVVSELAAS